MTMTTAVHRVSVAEYQRMITDGVLTTDDRVELLRGKIVPKMSQNEPHAMTIGRLNRILARLLPADVAFACQCPIVLDDSMPEPDFSISQPDTGRHPTPAELQIVVKVSDTTLRTDRGLKLELYAAAGIPVYWIVNIPDRVIEVYADPDAAAVPAIYRRVTTYTPADEVPVEVAGTVVGTVPAAAILP